MVEVFGAVVFALDLWEGVLVLCDRGDREARAVERHTSTIMSHSSSTAGSRERVRDASLYSGRRRSM